MGYLVAIVFMLFSSFPLWFFPKELKKVKYSVFSFGRTHKFCFSNEYLTCFDF